VIRRPRSALPVLVLACALALVPWIGWLVVSLPCRYLSRHWGIAWAGFDTGLALALALTGLAAIRRSPWLDRAAVAAGTLLATDIWFDVLTSRGAADTTLAAAEALGVELPLALLCLWLARADRAPRPDRSLPARPNTTTEGAF
jgi:hypothetical protein